MVETVLVTGGTGYVAGWCIVELLKRGYSVRTTVRSLSRQQMVRTAVSSSVSLDNSSNPSDPGDTLTFFAADLTSDSGWDEASAGCDYVLHVASPMTEDRGKDSSAMIEAAKEGTLRVLRAANRASVKRTVLTSSCAAASPVLSSGDSSSDEMVWTDTEDRNLNAYRRSKTLAERAAWQLMEDSHGTATLTTVLPGAVFGPVLTPGNQGSVQVIGRLVEGRVPGIPRLGFDVVDVRDLADLHIRAMTAPEAAGERFIATGDFMWMKEIASILRAELKEKAGKVPTRSLPDFVLRLLSVFDPTLRNVTPTLGRKHRHSSEKAQRLLGWRPRPGADTVVDCARSLLAYGLN